MTTIDGLLRRADEEGVQVFGITPTGFPGRGIGVMATRDLERGDIIMTIPVQAIHSLHTVPEDIVCKLSRDISIHGLLAAELALQHTASADLAELVPKWTDFEATIPYLWPAELQRLLPGEARCLLTKQQTKFEKDWDMFRNGFASKSRQDYLYAWLLVNTRAFYYETSAMMLFPWHDRLALLPVADLFNHSDTGCSVSFSTESYTVTADRRYYAGDEVYTSYGEHSNDFLLAEYGFLPSENRWDKVCLDDLLLPRLTPKQKSELRENGCLGDFILHDGLKKCDNIWIALRLLCCVDASWQRYIDGEEDAEGTLAKATELLPALLEGYLGRIKEIQTEIRALQVGRDCQQKLLVRRWEQIEALVRQAMVMNGPPYE
ncbi:Uncharacterized protein TPAR_01966 [Tolypocladium paradoxum]|uniref:SET domain-containing protein n=1 Tax=Tolypocladium paradoxum TaxID=94208 RepID=A0A2S4L5V2_9HYPO|nr:Uncharacterized protein TPAR_01966 [Tolypocladium paradoxum]